jgi:hypothetical protein
MVGTLSFTTEFSCVLLVAPSLCKTVGLRSVWLVSVRADFECLLCYSANPSFPE